MRQTIDDLTADKETLEMRVKDQEDEIKEEKEEASQKDKKNSSLIEDLKEQMNEEKTAK